MDEGRLKSRLWPDHWGRDVDTSFEVEIDELGSWVAVELRL